MPWPKRECPARHLRNFATQYTIEEPGVDADVLLKTVTKHYDNLHRFKAAKPIAAHTQAAFSALESQLEGIQTPLILDR